MNIENLKKLAGISVDGVPNDNTLDIIIQFIKSGNTNIKKLAIELKLTDQQLFDILLKLFSAMINGTGKHNSVPDSNFDKKQLELGVKIELEHTNNQYIAKMIAKDHLMELPDYYTKLKQMEKT